MKPENAPVWVRQLELALAKAGDVIAGLEQNGYQVHLTIGHNEGSESIELHELNGELTARVFKVEEVKACQR